VWDGSAIAHEDRRPYQDGAITTPNFNSVDYVHGVEKDRPFATLDASLAATSSSTTRAVSWTLRGMAEASTLADGSAGDCSLGIGACTYIAWIDGKAIYSRPTPANTATGGYSYLWSGSLLQDQQDKSGQLFRRNRYYDAQSGRFTQEDPIGLAGGMNLYGFAGGDPVNFSDPLGLTSCPPMCGIGSFNLAADMWDRGVEAVKQAAKSVVIYAKGNLGAASGEVEGDLAGGASAHFGGEASSEALGIEAGVRIDVARPAAGGHPVSFNSPGLRVAPGVRASVTATVSGDAQGGLKVNSFGIAIGASEGRFGPGNVGGVSTPVNSLPSACTASDCARP